MYKAIVRVFGNATTPMAELNQTYRSASTGRSQPGDVTKLLDIEIVAETPADLVRKVNIIMWVSILPASEQS